MTAPNTSVQLGVPTKTWPMFAFLPLCEIAVYRSDPDRAVIQVCAFTT
ncbi:hypothetical protein [Saccharopolyspora spinosa]|nr:hypothetical protein [Saccharopolyspora spinosa]